MGGSDNEVTKDLFEKNRLRLKQALIATDMKAEYLAHPTAQFLMTFREYMRKKGHRFVPGKSKKGRRRKLC